MITTKRCHFLLLTNSASAWDNLSPRSISALIESLQWSRNRPHVIYLLLALWHPNMISTWSSLHSSSLESSCLPETAWFPRWRWREVIGLFNVGNVWALSLLPPPGRMQAPHSLQFHRFPHVRRHNRGTRIDSPSDENLALKTPPTPFKIEPTVITSQTNIKWHAPVWATSVENPVESLQWYFNSVACQIVFLNQLSVPECIMDGKTVCISYGKKFSNLFLCYVLST